MAGPLAADTFSSLLLVIDPLPGYWRCGLVLSASLT
jgi:hypothetical protein